MNRSGHWAPDLDASGGEVSGHGPKPRRRRVNPANLANLLTTFRIVSVPVILWLITADWGPPGLVGDYGKIIGLLLAFTSGVTDYVDGLVARTQNIETKLGKFLDPVADKLYVCSIFVVLTVEGWMPSWILITMLWREFLVLGLRMQLASEGRVLGASNWAKFKTIFQIAAVVAHLMVQSLQVAAVSDLATIPWATVVYFHQMADSVVLLSVLLSVVSGMEYFLVHWHVLKRG